MINYLNVFDPQNNNEDEETIIAQCNDCLDAFGEAFNAGYLAGMDAYLHFPHILLSGNEVIIWEKPGQLPPNFFMNLKETGWTHTIQDLRKPILVSPNKVHYLIHYTRRRTDNTIISSHKNIWIITCINKKWGIALRSY